MKRACIASAFFSVVIGAVCPGARADNKPERPYLQDGSIGRSLPILADPGGLRSALYERGVTFQINDIAEALGNVSGGIKRGTRPGNRVELVVEADLEKSFGLSDTLLHANAFFISGTGLSRYDVGNIMPVSNIEALPAARLSELWIERAFPEQKVSLRVGQLAADADFINSTYAGLFVSGTFGWPTLAAADLPSGGPAYPFATPGARLLFAPNEQTKLLIGIFNGDPAGPGADDPQRRNRYGTNFRLSDPPLVIAEAQITYGDDKDPAKLSGVLKIGAWGHLGKFESQQYGPNVVRPVGVNAMTYRGDWGVYAVVDQQVLRLADDPKKGVGVFLRGAAAPSDRNLVDLYLDGGLNFNGMIAARPNDSFGIAAGFTHLSSGARSADLESIAQALSLYARGHSEALIEATYSAQIVEGWTVQPLLQYVIAPNGGVDATGHLRLTNATVIGLRSTIRY